MPEEPDLEPEDQKTADEDRAAQERRAESRRRTARDVAIIVFFLVLLLIVVDYHVTRGPGTRKFIANNIACLRCHTECLEEMRLADVHVPFEREQCTSCHTPHGRKVRAKTTDGEFGFQWLRRMLDRLYLNVLWRVFSEEWLIGERPKMPATNVSKTEKGPDSEFIMPLDQLCWTCHGNLGPQRQMQYQHRPFEAGQCLSCHRPHSSETQVLLRAPAPQLCPSCHPLGDELDDPQVHLPFGERQCLSCHKPHASDWRGVITMRQRNLCFSCHPSVAVLTNEPVQHTAFEKGECTDCHKYHSAAVKPLLIEKKPELCYMCHGSVRADFRRPSHHPDERIGCDCHLPHASDYTAVLTNKQPDLCFECHPEIDELNEIFFKHEPFAEDPCTKDCHTPHGSDAAPLLQERDPRLCFECHPPIEREFQLPSKHPVGTKLKCADCHEPHASWNRPLLDAKGRALCYKCHSTYEPVYERAQHRRYDCVKCHKWHGSQYGPLLVMPNPEVCIRCHRGYASRPYFHVTRPEYWDRNSSKPLTCTSSCHNPHGTPNYHMLRVPYGQFGKGTDFVCRLCHADIGIWY